MNKRQIVSLLALWLAATVCSAELPLEVLTTKSLPAKPGAHWVWVNDMSVTNMLDGKAHLVDADSGNYLGMLSTGYWHNRLVMPSDNKEIYSTQTYYPRATYGGRTDIVVVYDAKTLSPIAEIEIPPKRMTNFPTVGNVQITDNDRFLLVFNFNPAQTVSVVDVIERKFVGEIESAGCSFTYPLGNLRFFMICGDGTLMDVQLDSSGAVVSKSRTESFFQPPEDFIEEDGVRVGNTWYFSSRKGMVYSVSSAPKGLAFATPWSLLTETDRVAGWHTGGFHPVGVHLLSGRLYVLVLQGGEFSHKDAAEQVWVFDLGKKERIRQVRLNNPATIMRISQDTQPRLYTAFVASNSLDVYDALSGKFLRTVEDIGVSPTYLQTLR